MLGILSKFKKGKKNMETTTVTHRKPADPVKEARAKAAVEKAKAMVEARRKRGAAPSPAVVAAPVVDSSEKVEAKPAAATGSVAETRAKAAALKAKAIAEARAQARK